VERSKFKKKLLNIATLIDVETDDENAPAIYENATQIIIKNIFYHFCSLALEAWLILSCFLP
jgi:hypothetical protein